MADISSTGSAYPPVNKKRTTHEYLDKGKDSDEPVNCLIVVTYEQHIVVIKRMVVLNVDDDK